jgi:peroxiredoxin
MKKNSFLILFFLLAACGQPKREGLSTEIKPDSLPSFTMTLINGEQVMSNSLAGRVILIFYNPGCDHCQREAEDIRKNLSLFADYSLYFIAASPVETIKQFAKDYDLATQSNVVFAQAEVLEVMKAMGPMGTPALFIYSEDKQLVKKFDGETKVEEMAKFLQPGDIN